MDEYSVFISNATVVFDLFDENEWLKVIQGTLTIKAKTTFAFLDSNSFKNAIIERSELINNGIVILE